MYRAVAAIHKRTSSLIEVAIMDKLFIEITLMYALAQTIVRNFNGDRWTAAIKTFLENTKEYFQTNLDLDGEDSTEEHFHLDLDAKLDSDSAHVVYTNCCVLMQSLEPEIKEARECEMRAFIGHGCKSPKYALDREFYHALYQMEAAHKAQTALVTELVQLLSEDSAFKNNLLETRKKFFVDSFAPNAAINCHSAASDEETHCPICTEPYTTEDNLYTNESGSDGMRMTLACCQHKNSLCAGCLRSHAFTASDGGIEPHATCPFCRH